MVEKAPVAQLHKATRVHPMRRHRVIAREVVSVHHQNAMTFGGEPHGRGRPRAARSDNDHIVHPVNLPGASHDTKRGFAILSVAGLLCVLSVSAQAQTPIGASFRSGFGAFGLDVGGPVPAISGFDVAYTNGDHQI